MHDNLVARLQARRAQLWHSLLGPMSLEQARQVHLEVELIERRIAELTRQEAA